MRAVGAKRNVKWRRVAARGRAISAAEPEWVGGRSAVASQRAGDRPRRELEASMKAEPILAKLYELRKEASGDPEDMEFIALDHAFKFISYHMGEFQKYLREADPDDT